MTIPPEEGPTPNAVPNQKKERNSHKPHDQFALFLLQNSSWAQQLFQRVLPKELVEVMLWDTFERINDADTDESLHKTVTDIGYKVRCKGNFVLYLLLIVEHKSSPPRKHLPIEYQLMRYMVAKLNAFFDAVDQDLAEAQGETTEVPDGEHLFPLPLALVIYNGKQPWKVRPLRQYFRQAGAPEPLTNLVVDVPYALYDLSSQSKAALDADFADAPILRACLQSMKNIWTVDQQVEDFWPILKDLKKLPKRVIRAIFTYVQAAFAERKEFERVIQVIKAEKGDNIMGFYTDDLIASEAKGKEEGMETRARRTAKAMLQDNKPLEEIMRYTDLSQEVIDQLRQAL